MKVCDKCRSESVVEYKLSMIRPEPGSGERMRNATVFSRELELCQTCAPVVWQAVGDAVDSALRPPKPSA